jgi:hypothetical protein
VIGAISSEAETASRREIATKQECRAGRGKLETGFLAQSRLRILHELICASRCVHFESITFMTLD